LDDLWTGFEIAERNLIGHGWVAKRWPAIRLVCPHSSRKMITQRMAAESLLREYRVFAAMKQAAPKAKAGTFCPAILRVNPSADA
jgi:hypothetical protein